MVNYGDVTKIKGADVPRVDVITFGAPCQDLSVAGKRKGLKHEGMGDDETTRSGLFFEAIRIIKEMRNAPNNDNRMACRYAVYENVYGAFSSNGGEDFRAVLEETVRVKDKDAHIPGPPKEGWPHAGVIIGDGYSVAWRGHDAQYWGVPQRRKRVCVLADFDGITAGRVLFESELWRETQPGDTDQTIADFGNEPRPQIQFECESVPGDSEQGGKARERAAADSQSSVGETGEPILLESNQNHATIQTDGISTTLPASMGMGGGYVPMVASEPTILQRRFSSTNLFENGITPTLEAGAGEGGNNMPMVFEPGAMSRVGGHYYGDGISATVRADAGDNQQAICYGISPYDSNAMKSPNPHAGIYEAETSRTLDLNGGNPACNQGGMAICNGVDIYNQTLTGEVSKTLNSISSDADHVPCMIYKKTSHAKSSEDGQGWTETEKNDTLNAFDSGETRTPTLIVGAVESHPQDSRVKLNEDGVNQTISGNMEHDPANGGLVMVIENHPNDSRVKIREDGVFQTLDARMGMGGGNVPMVANTYQKVTGPLMASGYNKLGTEEAMSDMYVVPQNSISLETYHCETDTELVQTLKARDFKDPQCVAYGLDRAAYNQGQNAQFNFSVDKEKIGSQTAMGSGAVAVGCVRRLTPTECQRLQGFPDGWMDIGEWTDTQGKLHKDADSPKYKAAGNSIALPFWQWLAHKIKAEFDQDGVFEPKMASLFDGIAGFPLTFTRVGIEPLWASEIEEFPIAVVKRHFGENGDIQKYI